MNTPLPTQHRNAGTYTPPSPRPPYGTPPGPGWFPHAGPPPAWPAPPVQPPQRTSRGLIAAVAVGVVLLIGAVVAAAVVVGSGLSRVQAPSRPVVSFTPPAPAPPAPLPSLPSLPALSDPGGTWAIGSCAAPDPGDPTGGYRPVDCSRPGAVAMVTSRLDVTSADDARCLPGTDLVLELTRTRDGIDTGIPTGTACLRNLTAPHPGDPGQGGGQINEGDCIALPGAGFLHVTEVPCGTGGGRVLALLPKGSACPAGTTDPVEMVTPNSRFGVLCTRR